MAHQGSTTRDGHLGGWLTVPPEALDGDLDFRATTGILGRRKCQPTAQAPADASSPPYPADSVKCFAVHYYARLGNDEVEDLRLPSELEHLRIAEVIAVDLPGERPMAPDDEVVQVRAHFDVRPLA